MAAAVRNKSTQQRKGPPLQDSNSQRRNPAWRGPAPHAPSPASQSPRLPLSLPPADSPLPPPALIGHHIVVSTRTGARYEGALLALPASADPDALLQLKDVRDLVNPATPLKHVLSLPAATLASWSAPDRDPPLPAKANGNGDFRTDADISAGPGTVSRRERELQAWTPDDGALPPAASVGTRGDDATFGPGSTAPNGSWDQFAANEKMFGVTTSFDEEVYTTKIDRTAPDFKERERKAQAMANEILNATTNNPHIAEERNHNIDDSGANEEDKYSGVVRGVNAYIPPGARRAGSGGSIPQQTKSTTGPDIPQVSVTITDASSTPASKTTSPPAGATSPPTKDLIPTFRDFVTNEKQRLTQKRQAIVKNEMDKRMSELVKFSQSFKLNKPIPEDLVAILAKDEDKQKQIREKASRDAASSAARSIGAAHSANAPIPRVPAAVAPKPVPAAAPAPPKAVPPPPAAVKKEAAPARIPMTIQKIPPFNPNKSRGASADREKETKEKAEREKAEEAKEEKAPDGSFKLNANASSFKLKPNAPSFKPVVSPKTKPAEPVAQTSAPAAPTPPNPFFGTRIIKKGLPVHVKDDFNPFKHAAATNAKVPDASSVSQIWLYTGKRYAALFPPLPPPPPAAPLHLPPAAVPPPPPPPPPYEEDPAAQHARYGMVYAYAPYAYPGQPIMPGAPQGAGPPGNYIPSPFLAPMHYPPMPPNGHQAMYAPPPSMGSMPPPQQYMQPPPPGAYPPPNGAGRGSMPPTPMPPHAHAYAYHQSPQLSHAVPYQMMMPPGPPHGNYENGPPQPQPPPPPPQVPMGGVGHA